MFAAWISKDSLHSSGFCAKELEYMVFSRKINRKISVFPNAPSQFCGKWILTNPTHGCTMIAQFERRSDKTMYLYFYTFTFTSDCPLSKRV